MQESAMYQEMQSWAKTDADRDAAQNIETIALNCLRQGLPHQILAEATGLTIAQIQVLQAQL